MDYPLYFVCIVLSIITLASPFHSFAKSWRLSFADFANFMLLSSICGVFLGIAVGDLIRVIHTTISEYIVNVSH